MAIEKELMMGKDKTISIQRQNALNQFEDKLNGKLITYLNSCVHCGLCAESCHYYLAENDQCFIPGKKVDIIAGIYRRYHTVAGKYFPGLVGGRDLDDQTIEEMVDVMFGACSMCGRCTLHCSVGIDIPFLVRTARTMLYELNAVPASLQSTVTTALTTGNNMGIPQQELIDTLVWLQDDLQMEVADDTATIPIDQKGKNIFYTLNPREPKFFPLSISAMAKIFYAAKEEWTISSMAYDVTNYAWFSGDDQGGKELSGRLNDEMIRLEAGTMVLAECGHGFRAIRWESPNWLKKPFPFEVKSCIELMADYIRSGRIKLDSSLNDKLVTIHDPCNLVRGGGIIEEQRFIIKNVVQNFVEMTPNRTNNFCCGGGGGQLAMGEYNERRVKAGSIKAEQIRKTGAKIVATPCHNCIDQLMDLNQQYKLGVEIKTISEIVADAIVLT